MTAVEWLIEKLMKGEFINSTNELIEQAKIMDKEQKINFAESFIIRQNRIGTIGKGSYKKQAEQYYNETYGSKGSDEIKLPTQDDKIGSHIFDTYSIKQAKDDDINQLISNSVDYQNSTNMSNNIAEFNYRMNKRISNYLSTLPISSQTEISDEEIREQGIKYDNQALSETPIAHFMEGAFWYREQLKQRQ